MRHLILILCASLTVAASVPAFGQGVITFTDIAGAGGANTFTTGDSQVTINGSGALTAGGNFWGIDSGAAFNGTEFADFVFSPTVGLSGMSFRWTRAQITLAGFVSNPGVTVVTDPAPLDVTAAYDANTQSVIINHPWQAGSLSSISFSNPNASAGRTITMTVFDPVQAGWQSTIVDTSYALGTVPLIPGDVDGNGFVEIADYEIIRNHFFFTGVIRSQGDLVTNGIVDFDDFDQWKDSFPGGAGAAEAAIAGLIPEPTSAALFLIGAAMVGVASRRRATRVG